MNTRLSKLLSPEFDDAVGFILPTVALRLKLQALPETTEVTKAIRRGEIDEEEFRQFVSDQTTAIISGVQVSTDLALAALAVAVEKVRFDFAEEFLINLASLRVGELSTSSRTARECLKHRFELPANEVRTARLGPTSKPCGRLKLSSSNPSFFVRHRGGLHVVPIVFPKRSESR